LLAAVGILACQKKPRLFTKRVLPFENTLQETPEINIFSYEYAYNGGGVAAGDFNNDGRCDLYFTGNRVANKLFLNEGDFRFIDVTSKAGVAGREMWKTGVATADVNSDGLLDIYLCYSGPDLGQSFSNELFINQGFGEDGIPIFSEQAADYGLDAPGTCSTQALFFDFDRDGDLDMFLLNHANHFFSPFVNTRSLRNTRHPRFGNRLYQNNSDGKTSRFVDVTGQAGIHGGGINFGLGVSASDLNNDGWTDLYVSNDYEEQDFLYLNNQDGTFRDVTPYALGHFSRNGMGTDIADYNNDGRPDIVETDMWPEDHYRQKLLKGPDDYYRYQLMVDSGFHYQQMRNTLQLNTGILSCGTPVFSEVGQLAGISATDWSWAPLFVDLDNDGLKDLFISNGYLRDFTSMDFLQFTVSNAQIEAKKLGKELHLFELVSQMTSSKMSNYVFRNKGDLAFENLTDAWGLREPNLSFGAVYADLDNDGDVEIITNNTNEPAAIWQNNAEKIYRNNFLTVQLSGSEGNSFAIGAKVYVKTNTDTLLAEQFTTRGFQSAVPPALFFGLLRQEAVSVEVIWPDGAKTEMRDVSANQIVSIPYSRDLTAADAGQPGSGLFIDISSHSNINFVHRENSFVDFDREPLLLYQLSRNGPALSHADVNGDGNDDFYIGGALGQAGMLYFGNGSGQFQPAPSQPWHADKKCEDVSALFFDAEGDGDPDLFVVSGGNEYPTGSEFLDDRLYLNVGIGRFVRAPDNSIVADHVSGSCVAAADFDLDGDLDLFVGGASLPGNFPNASPGAILRNESDQKPYKPKFSVVTPLIAPELRLAGIISDAVWADFNNDQWPDLIIVGEWMGIRMFENKNGMLAEVESPDLVGLSGLWCRIVAADLDRDGDMDFVVGNAGVNLPWKVSLNTPLKMYYGDFDRNGKTDPPIFEFESGLLKPVASRDEMLRQLPFLKKKFTTYNSYAQAVLSDILSDDKLGQTRQLNLSTLLSGVLENLGNTRFRFFPLPIEAQLSSARAILVDDFNRDEITDILLAGNFFPFNTRTGPSDACQGLLLAGQQDKGRYQPVGWSTIGFYSPGDVRQMRRLINRNGAQFILQARNNDTLSIFKILNQK
jgi:hypothetical protein